MVNLVTMGDDVFFLVVGDLWINVDAIETIDLAGAEATLKTMEKEYTFSEEETQELRTFLRDKQSSDAWR